MVLDQKGLHSYLLQTKQLTLRLKELYLHFLNTLLKILQDLKLCISIVVNILLKKYLILKAV